MAALLADPEYARHVLEQQKKTGAATSSAPSLTTWSAEVAVLADLVDAVRENTATTVAAAGTPAKAPARYDRPRTAFDLVRHQMREEAHRALVARVLPNRQEEPG